MYESPITILMNQIEEQIQERRENAITAMVKEQLCIDVNRDELMRALNYDRGQYNAGYADGYKRGLEEGRTMAMTNLGHSLLRTYGGSDDTTEGNDELDA